MISNDSLLLKQLFAGNQPLKSRLFRAGCRNLPDPIFDSKIPNKTPQSPGEVAEGPKPLAEKFAKSVRTTGHIGNFKSDDPKKNNPLVSAGIPKLPQYFRPLP